MPQAKPYSQSLNFHSVTALRPYTSSSRSASHSPRRREPRVSPVISPSTYDMPPGLRSYCASFLQRMTGRSAPFKIETTSPSLMRLGLTPIYHCLVSKKRRVEQRTSRPFSTPGAAMYLNAACTKLPSEVGIYCNHSLSGLTGLSGAIVGTY